MGKFFELDLQGKNSFILKINQEGLYENLLLTRFEKIV
jgi:hypothetical protein